MNDINKLPKDREVSSLWIVADHPGSIRGAIHAAFQLGLVIDPAITKTDSPFSVGSLSALFLYKACMMPGDYRMNTRGKPTVAETIKLRDAIECAVVACSNADVLFALDEYPKKIITAFNGLQKEDRWSASNLAYSIAPYHSDELSFDRNRKACLELIEGYTSPR